MEKLNSGLCHNSFTVSGENGTDISFDINIVGSNNGIAEHHLQLFLNECPVLPPGHDVSEFDGLSFEVLGATVAADDIASAVYGWIKESIKKYVFYPNERNCLLFISGDIALGDFAGIFEKLEAGEKVEISPALYFEEGNASEVNVSLWWYDPVERGKRLTGEWQFYCDKKAKYARNLEETDIEGFVDLVSRTWHFLLQNRIEVEAPTDENSDINSDGLKRLLRKEKAMISLAEKLSAYAYAEDFNYKENPLYSVTLFLADELARLAAGKKPGIPSYDYKGDFMGISGAAMDLTLLSAGLRNQKQVYYDVDSKDYREILKLIDETE